MRGLAPRVQGNGGGHGKLGALNGLPAKRMAEKPDLTVDDLMAKLADRHGVAIPRVSVWQFLCGVSLTHKKRRSGPRAEATLGA